MEVENFDFTITKNGEFKDMEGLPISFDCENVEELTNYYELVMSKLNGNKSGFIAENILLDVNEKDNIKSKKVNLRSVILNENGSNIGIHAVDDESMKKVIKIIEDNFNINLDKLKVNYMKRRDCKKGVCDYIQGLNYNEAYLKSPSFMLKCTDEDKTKLHNLLNIPKRCNKWLWFPEKIEQTKQYMTCDIKNKYPIYVISKGRYYRNKKYQAPKTIQFLELIGCDYKIVVEPQEYELYAKSISVANIIILPDDYCGLDQGSIPVRNFVHHINMDAEEEAYWILDDNIVDYYWVDNNERYKVRSPIAFRFVEDIMDNFKNVYLCGHQYKMFSPPTDYRNAIQYNARVFSSILIRTDIPALTPNGDIWRGKYNEDVDLSLRILKMGLPTILTTGLSCDKERTGGKGGNEDIYIEDDNHSGEIKTKSLLENHSDCIDVVKRYGRTHHKIKTEMFENNIFIKEDNFEKHKYDIKYK